MLNLHGKRPSIRPPEFFGLIPEPNEKKILWSMVDVPCYIVAYFYWFWNIYIIIIIIDEAAWFVWDNQEA